MFSCSLMRSIMKWHEENALLSTVNVIFIQALFGRCHLNSRISTFWTLTCIACAAINSNCGDMVNEMPFKVIINEKPEMRLCATRKCLLLHSTCVCVCVSENAAVGPVGEGGNGCARGLRTCISRKWWKKLNNCKHTIYFLIHLRRSCNDCDIYGAAATASMSDI